MKKILKYLLPIIVIAIVYVAYTTYPKFDIVSGFSSKSIASHHFLAKRSQEMTELRDNDVPSMNMATSMVDEKSMSVTSSVYGMKERTAVYRKGLGSVLIPEGMTNKDLPAVPNREKLSANVPYPYGDLDQKDTVFLNVDYNRLNQAVKNAFDKGAEDVKKTRSVLVIYKDRIIAEQYKDGFDKNSLLLGWSMSKSITSAVLGVLERQGKVSLDQKDLFKEWENDERKNITLRNLLNMNSALAWEEDYTGISDVTEMLFLDADMSVKQKEKKLIGKPNEHWNYSSGTTNMLSGFIRNQFSTQQEYLDFWYEELIDKIGMRSMLIETDFSGKFVGSSYGWATARDWGKFGLLYLHDGHWRGEQIINKSWVDFSQEPTNTSNGRYGGHFWLNAGGIYPDVPKDLYSCNGFQGQYVFIIPSKGLVVVRAGLAYPPDFDVNVFLKEIVGSIN